MVLSYISARWCWRTAVGEVKSGPLCTLWRSHYSCLPLTRVRTLNFFSLDLGEGARHTPPLPLFQTARRPRSCSPRIPQRITQHQQPLVHARRHCITATDFRDRPETMLKVSPIEFGASLSIPFCCHPSAFCFPLSISFFSLLNCKYHVPSILFCYSVITLLLLSFCFFL